MIMRTKLCVQHFATSKNFSFKEFYLFSEKSFCKSNRKLFSCVCIAWYKHSRGWENSWQLCKPLTLSPVYIYLSWTSLIFISGYANAENVFYCLSGTCVLISINEDSSKSVHVGLLSYIPGVGDLVELHSTLEVFKSSQCNIHWKRWWLQRNGKSSVVSKMLQHGLSNLTLYLC